MIRLNERTIVSTIVLAILVAFLAATSSLSPTARIVPLIVLVPTLLLGTLQLVLDLVPTLHARFGGDEAAPPEDAPGRRRLEIVLVTWIAALLGLVVLFGLLGALPAYTLIYLRLCARESWSISLAVALGVLAVIYGVFVLGLRLRLYEGLVPSLFGL
jgi:hypothetical protein